MRGLGLYFGPQKRNDNYILEDPHPVTLYGDLYKTDVTSGDAGLDGFSCLSRADPDRMGDPPSVQGTLGRAHRGPDSSFEQ
jgi:hypothetical protein